MANQPEWTYKENAIRLWLFGAAVACGFVAYLSFDWRREDADLQLKVQELAANEVRMALAPIEERLKYATTRESEANAKVAELEAIRSGSQLLVVKPQVFQTHSVEDIREITIHVEFENAGVAAALLSSIRVEVYEAMPSLASTSQIQRTQALYHLRQAVHDSEHRADQAIEPWRDEVRKQIDNLHADCPHGKLYAIDADSRDVEWTRLEHMTRTLKIGSTLSPESAAFKRFSYLLTEYPEQHHRQWFRFVIIVNPGIAEVEQQFEFIVSGLPVSGVASDAYQTSWRVQFVGRPALWDPEIPLLPSASENPSDGHQHP